MIPPINVNKLVEDVGEAADNLHTSDEEERELISRVHESDMRSDSWLSKNIRPIFLIFCIFALLLCVMLEGFDIQVPENVYDLLSTWGGIAISFYFGTRGWQHVERVKQKGRVIEAQIIRKNNKSVAKIERKSERKGLLGRRKKD